MASKEQQLEKEKEKALEAGARGTELSAQMKANQDLILRVTALEVSEALNSHSHTTPHLLLHASHATVGPTYQLPHAHGMPVGTRSIHALRPSTRLPVPRRPTSFQAVMRVCDRVNNYIEGKQIAGSYDSLTMRFQSVRGLRDTDSQRISRPEIMTSNNIFVGG